MLVNKEFHYKTLYYDRYILIGFLLLSLFVIIVAFINPPTGLMLNRILSSLVLTGFILFSTAISYFSIIYTYKNIYFDYYIYSDKFIVENCFIPFYFDNEKEIDFKDVRKIKTVFSFFRRLGNTNAYFYYKKSKPIHIIIPKSIERDLKNSFKLYQMNNGKKQ